MPKKYSFCFLLLIFTGLLGHSQNSENAGMSAFSSEFPRTTYFDRNAFLADSQFWTMCEDAKGVFIFGNNDGAVVFDGENWTKIKLPNNSSVRSLVLDSEGKIYAGGFNEIGTFQRDKQGVYFYTSLINKFHLEGSNLENLWQAHLVDSRIIFRAFNALIVISENTALQIPARKAFVYSNVVNNSLWVQDEDYGLYRLDLKSLQLVDEIPAKLFENETLTAILAGEKSNELYLISKNGKVYILDSLKKSVSFWFNLFEENKNDRVTSALKFRKDKYIVSTLNSRIIEFNPKGKVTRNNSVFADVKNTTIHNLFVTRKNNLWVMLNNGLNYLDFNSPYVQIFDQASVYDILINNSNLYVATNIGVYQSRLTTEFSKYTFEKIKNLNGQTWAVQSLDGDVLISHDDGLYKLENNEAIKIGDVKGFWKVSPVKGQPNWFLASNYNGLYLLEKNQGNWIIKNKIYGFDESTRDILAADEANTYWVCHGFKGVYRIVINNDYTRVNAIEHFTNQNGLPSFYNVNVTRWKNKIIFTTNTGIYTFNEKTKIFEPFDALNKILNPTQNTRKLIEKDNRIWFVQDDEAGFVDLNDSDKKMNKDIFLNLKGSFNRGMESITPLDKNKVLLGTNTGLFLYSTDQSDAETIAQTLITKITYTLNQKTEEAEIKHDNDGIELPNQINILRFDFAVPELFSETKTQYSYKLSPIDNDWSTWQTKAYKEYTHLRPGRYTFSVKSQNLTGTKGQEITYTFSILPKWYQTNLAMVIYLILLVLFSYVCYNFLHKYIAKKNHEALAEEKKTKKLLELEIAQLKLKTENKKITKDRDFLEENIIEKSKELANYTLMLSQKKKMFSEMQEDLKQLRPTLKSDESRKKVTEIFQKLHQNKIGEEYMEIFDVNFEKIHHNFFEKLKRINPTFTQRELRLCAFIKMNMLNKEISSLLNISTRGVESARYRVRKKLNVTHDDNLVAFLENLDKKK